MPLHVMKLEITFEAPNVLPVSVVERDAREDPHAADEFFERLGDVPDSAITHLKLSVEPPWSPYE